MKKLDEKICEYIIIKMVEEGETIEKVGPLDYHYHVKYNNFSFKFSYDKKAKEILISRGNKDDNLCWFYLGTIDINYSLKPHFEFASQLFDLAIEGITREANAANLEKELPVNGNVVKTKIIKI